MQRFNRFALVFIMLFMVGALYFVQREERSTALYNECIQRQHNRVQGNERAEAVILLRESTLEAHAQAIKKGIITEPVQDSRLKSLNLHTLPAVQC